MKKTRFHTKSYLRRKEVKDSQIKPPVSPNLSPISGFPEQFNDSQFGEPNDVSKWDEFIAEKSSPTHSPVGSPQRHTEYD